jgi:stage II sporulation protein R
VLVCCFYTGGLLADKQTLQQELIRLHVVGASDSAEDQAVKLQVRDAVIASLEHALSDATDMTQARAYIESHLPQIEAAANDALRELGLTDRAVVTFLEEAFPIREYDTFTLPSGVYESLRITIGEGEGKNWWCVVFPSLCFGSTDEVQEVAAGAGFSDGLTGAVTRKENYRIRFYFLDLLGKVENFFFGD